ncbi:Two component system sensor histidine kinase, PAS + GAF domain [Desulfosarcina cetonica]|uniref:PAS domain S-box protein n=1 Tax=Desulfosarcina cetonica TaxID=90730 RepID=UPI0006CF4FD4|nr:PAS domain S-box protein [Desulfosarcina cetonica]VTR67510.1 Two component system sensor histidine kinase, PAS + GAF domain [Desulfosarcina cetonica]
MSDERVKSRSAKGFVTRPQDAHAGESLAEHRYRAFLEFLPDPVFVGHPDSTVAYLNPAFEKVFGWSLKELAGQRIPYIPDSEMAATRAGVKKLFTDHVLHGYETRRLTRDGRILDVLVDAAVFHDADGKPAGQVITLRDITARKRVEQTNQVLLRIASALYRFPRLELMLAHITRQIQTLIRAEGAAVILLDEAAGEFYIPVASYVDNRIGSRMKGVRFPVDKGVAGHVYRTGEPMIVPDTAKSPYFYEMVDKTVFYRHKNMLDVPMHLQDRIIGILCAVNKQEGMFDRSDVDLLSAVANLVALPIENARINEALQQSYENVRDLNRAKEEVIHHLSHELKTPLSVISASLGLLAKRFPHGQDRRLDRIMARMRRNLKRLLDMQYEIADMLREKHYQAHGMLSFLLAASRDMLISLIESAPRSDQAPDVIQMTIDREFGRADDPVSPIVLDRMVARFLETLKPSFLHRRIRFTTRLTPVAPVLLPMEVMEKIVEGLVKNAIENTPDQGRVTVVVENGEGGPVFAVEDSGVGITAARQRLIFNHYFTAGETLTYASRAPYDFNAGGRGFDLLRIAIFAERYGFATQMASRRCGYIPLDRDLCPGAVERCAHCRDTADCDASGGTTMRILFRSSALGRPAEPKTNHRSTVRNTDERQCTHRSG